MRAQSMMVRLGWAWVAGEPDGKKMGWRKESISRDFGTPGWEGLYPSMRIWKEEPSEQSRVIVGWLGELRTRVRTEIGGLILNNLRD